MHLELPKNSLVKTCKAGRQCSARKVALEVLFAGLSHLFGSPAADPSLLMKRSGDRGPAACQWLEYLTKGIQKVTLGNPQIFR